MNVRSRYAPSPTGMQHIGSVRTVLFEYLLAKANSGTFYLRIEDTDQSRSTEGAVEDLYATLNWLNIKWDEGPDIGGPYGPYVQSERFDLYRKYAEQLIGEKKAYYCYCTEQRLEELRKSQESEKKSIGYDRHCRNLSREEREKAEAELKVAGGRPVVRFALPEDESRRVVIEDALLGEVKRKVKDINPDPVILKSDGFPTYHFAHVIDDTLMKTTHVLRGQEWLPSAPLHVLLFEAFGWEAPKYVHLPMVLGKDGQKLSKRHGDTAVREFREAGYLPEALVNYLSLVGWSYDDKREFFTLKELEECFTLDKLNKAPGVFDYKKLDWFNGQYIRQKSEQELTDLIIPYLIKDGLVHDPPNPDESEIIVQMIPLVQPRLKKLGDVPALVRFLFRDVPVDDIELLIPKKCELSDVLPWLEKGREILSALTSFNMTDIETSFEKAAEEMGTKLGNLMMPLRVCVTGSGMSPPLLESVLLMGLDEALKRVDRGIELVKKVLK